jgi:hypothetical protein
MLKKSILFLLYLVLVCLIPVSTLHSQEEPFDIEELKKDAPKVFIDCQRCDIDYIRTEITFVNYVWDRKEADIHILITLQDTGSGGREYTIALIGLKEYDDLQNSLQYFSSPTETSDEIREGLVQTLKLGLGPYVARTPMAKGVSLSLIQSVKPTAVEDKWNFWVFNISASSEMSGEEQKGSTD